jgi:membrane associated rhomboid family serine protease
MMTFVLIGITVLISIAAFNSNELHGKLLFNPYITLQRKEWYRLLSHGFVHADFWHLFMNMFVLYFFGRNIEMYFNYLESIDYMHFPAIWFTLFYLMGIVVATLPTLYKHKDDAYYNSVGASGAVSAVLFCSIFFEPYRMVYFYGIIGVPGILFGILYLVYSQYMSKRNMDNINHDAHFAGAVFGFIFPLFINYKLIFHFLEQITNFSFR